MKAVHCGWAVGSRRSGCLATDRHCRRAGDEQECWCCHFGGGKSRQVLDYSTATAFCGDMEEWPDSLLFYICNPQLLSFALIVKQSLFCHSLPPPTYTHKDTPCLYFLVEMKLDHTQVCWWHWVGLGSEHRHFETRQCHCASEAAVLCCISYLNSFFCWRGLSDMATVAFLQASSDISEIAHPLQVQQLCAALSFT